jgi:c-di-GMP-binding flagellar brake protein YcgR
MIDIAKDNREKMSEIIQGMFLDLNPVVSWDILENKRTIYPVKIENVDNEKETLSFKSAKDEDLSFAGDTIYFYSEDQKAIFKASLKEITGRLITVQLPEMIRVLEQQEETDLDDLFVIFKNEINLVAATGMESFSLDDEVVEGKSDEDLSEDLVSSVENITDHISTKQVVSSYTEHIETNWVTKKMSDHDADLFNAELSYITLEDEDKLFEEVRSTPRAKPPEGKMITVQISDESRGQSTHNLYDLSQGGLSFLVFTSEEFKAGEKIVIKAFDTNKFETPMLVIVKAVREADDMGIQYKVGCEFIDE